MNKQKNDFTKSELIIRNSKVVEFYNKHKEIDIEQVNLLYVELFENIMMSSFDNSSIVNHVISALTNQNNDIARLSQSLNELHESTKKESENMRNINSLNMDQLKSSLQSISLSLTNKIYETKDIYIKEVKDHMKANENETTLSLFTMLEKHNINLTDKLVNQINDSIPKAQSKQYDELINLFKTDMLTSLNSLSELKNQDPNLMIEKMSNIIDSKYNSLLSNIQENVINNISQSENRLNVSLCQIKDISQKGCNIQELLNEQMIKSKTAVNKGNLGEKQLFDVINDAYPSGELINSSSENKAGDMILKRTNKPDILIETKAYTTPVKKEEVEKFLRDIVNVKHSGIFISQHSGVVGKNDMQVDIHNKHILIYIHSCEYDPYKIKCAINMIDVLYEKLININTEGVTISVDLLNDINAEYQSFIIQKDKMLCGLKDFYKKSLEQYNDLHLPNLDKYISTHYANAKKEKLHCDICKKYDTYKLTSLARHTQSCKKKNTKVQTEAISTSTSSSDENIIV